MHREQNNTPAATTPSPGTTADVDRHTVAAWRNALFAIFAISGFGVASWVGRIPTIRDLLQASTFQMGLVVLGLSGGAITGLVASSAFLTRYGTRKSIAGNLLLAGVGIAIAGIGAEMGSFVTVMTGLALFGFGTSVTDVAGNVSGAASERAIGRSVLPLYHASFSVGTVTGAALGVFGAAVGVPVLAQLAGAGVLVAVVGVTSVRYLREPMAPTGTSQAQQTPDRETVATKRSWFARWRDGRTLLLGLIVLGLAFAEGSANDWLALAMVDGHGVSHTGGAIAVSVFLISMTIGRIAGVRLLDRYGRVPVLQASAALAVIGLGTLILAPAVWAAGLGVVLWGLGSALGFPVGMSAAADDPSRAAERVSTVAIIGYMAFLVGPPVVGLLGEHIGLLNALGLVLILIVVAGLASPAAREQHDTEPGVAGTVQPNAR